MPLLSQPATIPPPQESGEVDLEAQGGEEDVEEEEAPTKKGGKKAKGGGGKKGKSGKGKKEKEKGDKPEEDEAEAGGEVLLIDEIWPKKEALGLTKWYVCRICSLFRLFVGMWYPRLLDLDLSGLGLGLGLGRELL
jgi:PUA domain protein